LVLLLHAFQHYFDLMALPAKDFRDGEEYFLSAARQCLVLQSRFYALVLADHFLAELP
jgi:hypothetical protein